MRYFKRRMSQNHASDNASFFAFSSIPNPTPEHADLIIGSWNFQLLE